MGLVSTHGQMGGGMMATGGMTRWMEMASSFGPMAKSILVNGKMTKGMGMVFLSSLTKQDSKESGKMMSL